MEFEYTMALRIKFFGGPVVTDETGQRVHFPTRKSEALFVYLVEQSSHAISREVLADLLWPYSGPEQSRASLRQEVSVLRKALGLSHADSIFSVADRIGFSQDGSVVDLRRFNAISSSQSIATQKELLALYTAPFLDSFRIRSQPFSDWVWVTRQAQEATALRFGNTVMRQWADDGYADDIAEIAQRLCKIDPTYEPAHQGLVEYYIKQGDFHQAKRQLQQCETALKTHLDIEPSIDTQRLAEKLERHSAESSRQNVVTTPPNSQTQPEQHRRFVFVLSILPNIQTEDPEEFESGVQEFAAVTKQVVEARGGTQLHLGNDRILACFGYPKTHDRMADAAVGAALDILGALEKSPHQNAGCQIGIAAGLVLITDTDKMGNGDLKISGAVIRDAEELAIATPQGAVYVNDTVHSVLTPAVQLKTVANQHNVKQAISNQASESFPTYDLMRASSYAMVGRNAPLAHVLANLDQAQAGVGGAVAVVGVPGAGKSRFVEEVAVVARTKGFDIKFFQGNLNEHRSTLSPVIDHMLRAGAFKTAALENPRQPLERWLSDVCPELSTATAYFSSLTSHTDDGAIDDAPIPKEIRELASNIFGAMAGRATPQHPVLLVFEDTQWFDPTTCEALGRLFEAISGAPVCVLLVAREGEAPEVLGHPMVQTILLSPLDPQSAGTLLRGLLKGTSVSENTLANILQRAEGNPLFLEEFAKALDAREKRGGLAEIGVSSANTQGDKEVIAAPDRLLPLLLSRIDNVPGAIQVLQHASIFGRRFTLTHLSKILLPVVVRLPLLKELETAGIVFATQRGQETTYIFKHALINEAIYSTIPLRNRSALHKLAGRALNDDNLRINDAQIARHYRDASAYNEAGEFFEISGDQAVRGAAHTAAILEYTEALIMIGHLPLSRNRMSKELILNRKIAAQIIGSRGIPTSRASPYYLTAQDLSRELGDQEEAVNAAWGLWSIHLMVAELDDCLSILKAVDLDLDDQASPEAKLIVSYMLGVTYAYRGSLEQAAEYLENVASFDPVSRKDDLLHRFGMDIGLTTDSFLCLVYALQGQTDRATAASNRALQRAKENNDGLSRAFAHVFSANKCLFLGQVDEARQLAGIALKESQKMGFKQWISQSKLQLARVADLTGDPDALGVLQQALFEYQQTSMVLARPYAQVWIAEAMIRKGQYRAALQELDDLREFTMASKEQYYDAIALDAREQALRHLADEEVNLVRSIGGGP